MQRRQTESPPIALHARAEDNLRFIRTTMERAGSFTAVPGWGGVGMGVTALGAAYIAAGRAADAWLMIWLIEAAAAFVIASIGTAWKAKRAQALVFGGAGRRFWIGFAAPAVAGALLTLALVRADAFELLPATWLLLYGAAVVAGGGSSVKIVPLMGVCFMVLGAVAIVSPATWHDALMALGFGALQIIFGLRIARKHGG